MFVLVGTGYRASINVESCRIVKREEENSKKYRDLRIKIGRICKRRANIVPLVNEVLGIISKNHVKHLGELECNIVYYLI